MTAFVSLVFHSEQNYSSSKKKYDECIYCEMLANAPAKYIWSLIDNDAKIMWVSKTSFRLYWFHISYWFHVSWTALDLQIKQ